MLAHSPISYSRNKQHTISISTADFEYRGAMNVATQCVWLQGIFGQLVFSFDSPIVIWCDNQSVINIFNDLVHRQSIKHIEIHMHHI